MCLRVNHSTAFETEGSIPHVEPSLNVNILTGTGPNNLPHEFFPFNVTKIDEILSQEHLKESVEYASGSPEYPLAIRYLIDERSRLGLSKEDWEKFSALLEKMGVTMVSNQRRGTGRKTGRKSSGRKGVRELKNLKCDINYETSKGGNAIERGELIHQ